MKPSYYYKYNFISPEPLFARIKEELGSYFRTGVIDDVLFPTYVDDCLRNLGRSSYQIVPHVLKVEDYTAKLPKDFIFAREVWLTTSADRNYTMPNSCYEQSTCRVTPYTDRCEPCDNCAPSEIRVTYKTTGTIIQRFNCHYLLKPGNINSFDNCSVDSPNRNSLADETFDIRDGKIITNFPTGTLYLTYYAKEYDDNDNQLIPENHSIESYIENYLKFKCFQNILNNVFDETVNQLWQKLQYYESKYLDAKVNAETEIKKQTLEKQIMATRAARRRINRFKIT